MSNFIHLFPKSFLWVEKRFCYYYIDKTKRVSVISRKMRCFFKSIGLWISLPKSLRFLIFSCYLEERWSRNTSGTQQMMRKKLQRDTLQKLQKWELVLSQAKFLSSSLEDSEERESSASSNSNPDFFALPDHTKSMVSQSRESTKPIPWLPAPRSMFPESRLTASLMKLSRRRAKLPELNPKSSSPKTLQRRPSLRRERSSKRRLTPPSSPSWRTPWWRSISAPDSPSLKVMLLMPWNSEFLARRCKISQLEPRWWVDNHIN